MSDRTLIKIRQIQDTDYEALADFLEENNKPEITRHFHPFPLTSQTAHQIACAMHLDRYYIGILKGRIVALCMLRGWDEGFDIPSFGIIVDYRHQGLGLSSQMTEFAIAQARELECPSIRLSVYASNIRALGIYKSLGFKETSRERVIVEAEQDTRIIMIKDLEDEHAD